MATSEERADAATQRVEDACGDLAGGFVPLSPSGCDVKRGGVSELLCVRNNADNGDSEASAERFRRAEFADRTDDRVGRS